MSGTSEGIIVANAPVSYGAFEVTVGIDPNVPDAAMVLDEVADAGYAGIDLGPVGYLGDRASLANALESRGLILSGGFFELPFSDPAAMPAGRTHTGKSMVSRLPGSPRSTSQTAVVAPPDTCNCTTGIPCSVVVVASG